MSKSDKKSDQSTTKATAESGNGKPTIYSRKHHSVSRTDIDPDALKIMYRLIRHGYKAYLVGGGVRDLLLSKRPKDFDIATDATPRKIKTLFRNCRIIGRRFKLAHVYFRNNKIIEVSTFRDQNDREDPSQNDNETPERLARDNVFGTPKTDAFRRDLTINGLFYDLSSFSVIDYVGGISDLKSKIIRIIGDPKTRISEDPVRMLRAVRHAARAEFAIEPNTREAITELHDLIEKDSQVRVYEEIKKDLTYGYALKTMRLLAETSLLDHMLPELLLNDAVLLKEGSYFSEVIGRIDSSKNGDNEQETPITPVLAVIVLFLASYPDSFSSLLEHFILDESPPDEKHDREELSDHLSSCFVRLSVPRKERERIEEVLSLWLKLHRLPSDRTKKMNLERRKCIEDLYLLMSWLNDEGHDGQLLSLVEQAAEKRGKHPTSSQPVPHRRQRQDNKKRNHSGKRKQRRRN